MLFINLVGKGKLNIWVFKGFSGEGEFGGEWILVYVWLSPFTVLSPETITTVLIGNTLMP